MALYFLYPANRYVFSHSKTSVQNCLSAISYLVVYMNISSCIFIISLNLTPDFTPSRGNTPVHPLAGNLTGNRTPAYFLQSSPTDKKKRLSELFEESLRSDLDQNGQNAEDKQNGTNTKKETASTGAQLPPRSTPGTPYASVCSSERTPSGLLKSDVKTSKSAQCCLPRLLSSRSFNGRRSRMSPARNVG